METKKTRHSRYNIFYHFVWIHKYRKIFLTSERSAEFKAILSDIATDKKLEIVSLEAMPDHIHLFVSSPPQYSPSLLINWFKGISARKYNHRHKDHIKWTNSYYVGTAGNVSKETIKRYIQEQKRKYNLR